MELVKQISSGTTDPTSEKHKDLQSRAKKIADLSNNLKRRGVKDNIMREAKEIFYDSSFVDKVDANPRLMCFANGVYDFDRRACLYSVYGVDRNSRRSGDLLSWTGCW